MRRQECAALERVCAKDRGTRSEFLAQKCRHERREQARPAKHAASLQCAKATVRFISLRPHHGYRALVSLHEEKATISPKDTQDADVCHTHQGSPREIWSHGLH